MVIIHLIKLYQFLKIFFTRENYNFIQLRNIDDVIKEHSTLDTYVIPNQHFTKILELLYNGVRFFKVGYDFPNGNSERS